MSFLKIKYPAILLLVVLLLALISCEKTYLPTGVVEKPMIFPSIASIEPNNAGSEAIVTLKLPNDAPEGFPLELIDDSGKRTTVQANKNELIGDFQLKHYQVTGLAAGSKYNLELSYEDEQKSTITIRRSFLSRSSGNWKKLPDANFSKGDFTGAAVLSERHNSQLAVYRFKDTRTWDILKFNGKWDRFDSEIPVPRHSAIAFPLTEEGGRQVVFMGFGYIDDEKLSTKKAYLNDFWWSPGFTTIGLDSKIVFPLYEGIDKEIKFFSTAEKAYLLKENDLGNMWSMNIAWDQKTCKPLPEKTGKITAFTINETGYVVNQVSSKPPRLYAYSIANNEWTRKADFPGVVRENGISFSANGKGYFGLGVDAGGNGLRDIWEYNPETNSWRFHSDYPGQGSRQLITFSDKNRAFLGWGYETRKPENSQSIQIIGCTDFWEFKP